MTWIQDIMNPKKRLWEEMYRNRWQYDKRVRSTHGVNCTGGCSWDVYVKDGIVTWELQATDYPLLEPGIPHYEPRGCQRGITYSWYIYSPLRVKYPYIRGVLIDRWRDARSRHKDPVDAWASIMQDEAGRSRIHQARGRGGFRRSTWDECLEIIAASTVYTAKKYGPDRVIGFSPIPAMSMLSYAGGTRFLQLFGGVALSFYDWYADFPAAFPEVWGEKTDVAESADWYNSKLIVTMGSNLNMTRTPDVHFAAEARYNGAKLVVTSPDFSQVSRYADWWLPINAGQDGAFWMAVDHVIMKEFYLDRQVPYFIDYLRRFSDAPFLIELEEQDGSYRAGRFVRANSVARYQNEEKGDWKFLVFDEASGDVRMPQGSMGHRWQEKKGQWNLDLKDGLDGRTILPLLTLLDKNASVLPVVFTEFATDTPFTRSLPVRFVKTVKGQVPVATVFDILLAHHGVNRGITGEAPIGYGDSDAPYTPAWQEKYTGIGRESVVRFAREWAQTAERTRGKCSIIIGSGANHWYHSNITYRAAITALMLCGCMGVNGGGMNHYTGQEKIAPETSWKSIAFALDWNKYARLMNTPSFHYVHCDHWRYDPPHGGPVLGNVHPIDMQINAVRMGWLPFFPQFNRSTIELTREAEQSGAKTPDEIVAWLVRQLKERNVRFAVEDPDAPENWPRVWYIWRGNTLLTSAKGHEYFRRHYLGTLSNAIADEVDPSSTKEVVRDKPAPIGKFDLVIDMNFRMDTSALYSDIVLPSATWYEKDDMNTTDLHSYIHPLSAAVPPCWESKSDWEIFKAITAKVSEVAVPHFPEPFRDIIARPLQHDTIQELAQPEVKNWYRGECEPIPGKTMPQFSIVERDYSLLSQKFALYGHEECDEGFAERGISWQVTDLYDAFTKGAPTETWNNKTYLSIANARDAANVILFFAPETNGEIAYRGFQAMEKAVGHPMADDLAEAHRAVRYYFDDLIDQPRRILTSPVWSGITNNGRPYSAYCINVEKLMPWRTLTGRQALYIDHEAYLDAGESLPAFKPKIGTHGTEDFKKSVKPAKYLVVNCITPHGKWHIHTTYYDNLIMLTLNRGVEPFWLNTDDAREIGVMDNDWVEVYNDNGVFVTRASVSVRIPRGIGIFYHAPERTIDFPKSPSRGNRRGEGTNSFTRIRLKPSLMAGGYAQLSYAFNAWGPPATDRDFYTIVRKLEGKPEF